jgi:SAM-dependent MidA family methyltransferase
MRFSFFHKPAFMCLTEIIKTRIANEGPISFHDFMEMALYYPGLGYYTSNCNRIGKDGDYYTSPHFTSLFGEMIAKQLEEMWLLLGKRQFTVVEYGAGQGLLCLDILNELKQNKDLYDGLNYCIIEKSPAMRQKEKNILHEKVTWHDSIKDIGGFCGCIISNELLDNFAVHRVVMEDELKEIYVDHCNGFKEIMLPASYQLKNYFNQLNITLPAGYYTELNLQATEWIKENAMALREGFVMTIDYGYPSSELYNGHRSSGTIACYHKHSVNRNLYDNIGEQDITAHVNFSALQHWGMKNGLSQCGYTSQADFLRSMGLVSHLEKLEQKGKQLYTGNMGKMQLIHTLLMDMGQKFKVLIQEKRAQRSNLSGMRLARQIT